VDGGNEDQVKARLEGVEVLVVAVEEILNTFKTRVLGNAQLKFTLNSVASEVLVRVKVKVTTVPYSKLEFGVADPEMNIVG